MAEELDLHLLEFSASESVISRIDLVAECFTDLSDPKRYFKPAGIQDVLEIDKNTLGRFRTQIGQGGFILQSPHEGFEHQIEGAWLGQLALVVLPRRFTWFERASRCGQLVGSKTPFAALGFTIDHQVGKAAGMPAGYPYLGIHNNRAIQPDDRNFLSIRAERRVAYHVLPPRFFDVAFQFDA